MTTTSILKPSLASLKLPKPVPALLQLGKSIVQSMTSNAAFTTPSPTLAAVMVAITELEAAQNAVKARTPGAVATRNDKRAVLETLLTQLKAYIQKTADGSAENSTAVIQSAGMSVRKVPVRPKRVFAAKPGAVSGTVKLVTDSAARRASYEWQTSTDGGKTWVAAASTLQAKTTVTGLTPGATVLFRYRAVTRTGEADWGQPTSLIVK